MLWMIEFINWFSCEKATKIFSLTLKRRASLVDVSLEIWIPIDEFNNFNDTDIIHSKYE